MTIKQQGGIFGRNPTFNDVTTNSLTVNGDETITGSLTVDGDALFVNGANNRVGINNLSPSTTFDVSGNVYASGIIRNTGGGSASSPSFQPGVDGDTGMFHPASNTIGFTTAGSEKLRILTSGGITFNGDTATANALDDYEEGTWTPTVTSTSGTITTVDDVEGFYTKIGRQVTVYAHAKTTDNGTGAGNLRFSGLPFTPVSTDMSATGFIGVGYNSSSGKLLRGRITGGNTRIDVGNYDGTYPTANGRSNSVQVTYYV